MRLFIDSANLGEIEAAIDGGFISGITTNPSLLSKEQYQLNQNVHIRNIINLLDRRAFPVPLSVEVYSTNPDEMYEQATIILNEFLDYPEIYIKIPIALENLWVINRITLDGGKVNCTAVMTVEQAIMAENAGADFISIFWGRIRDSGARGEWIVGPTRKLLDQAGSRSKIIVGSIRAAYDVTNAFIAGAHIVTVPPKFFKEMCSHPETDKVVNQFMTDYKKWSGAK